MTAIDPNTGLLILGAAVAVLASLAWDRGCSCAECVVHTTKRRMDEQHKREADHEQAHRMWDSCGDKACPRHHEREKKDRRP